MIFWEEKFLQGLEKITQLYTHKIIDDEQLFRAVKGVIDHLRGLEVTDQTEWINQAFLSLTYTCSEPLALRIKEYSGNKG